MSSQSQLDQIAQAIANCRECKKGKSGLPVPGEGNPDADIVFLGEAPGRNEAQTGRPFIGRSGQLLRRMIREVGLSEEVVYITSPVKYLPDRGTPTKKDIAHGRMHLSKQLAVIKPKVIVLLGATACYAMLEKVVPVMKVHGEIIVDDGRQYLVTIHPAAVLRFPKYAGIMKEDFEKLKSIVY
jgi:uracil-DNA glycosylase family 4